MKTQATHLKSKKFLYRNYKHFDEKTFLSELESKNSVQNSIFSNDNYEYLSYYQFADIVNKHALLKTNVLRDNNGSFINKHLRKDIYRRSALRNRFNRKQIQLGKI